MSKKQNKIILRLDKKESKDINYIVLGERCELVIIFN